MNVEIPCYNPTDQICHCEDELRNILEVIDYSDINKTDEQLQTVIRVLQETISCRKKMAEEFQLPTTVVGFTQEMINLANGYMKRICKRFNLYIRLSDKTEHYGNVYIGIANFHPSSRIIIKEQIIYTEILHICYPVITVVNGESQPMPIENIASIKIISLKEK